MTRAQTAQRPRRSARPVTDAVHAQVRRVEQVSPHVRRVTVGGDGLAHFTVRGADQWFRLFLPRDGQVRPQLPATANWWQELLATPEHVRPIVRNYTVRAARPELGEIDIDVVVHGDEGPASRWALRTEPGDWIGLLDQGVLYEPPGDAAWQLLVGDETALPAIAGIVESLPEGTHAYVFVELPSADDEQPLRAGEHVHVSWLPRPEGAAPGSVVHDAVRAARLPAGEPYVWLAGESAMVRRVRRHLVGQRGVTKSSIEFTGYWRRGASYYS